MCGAVFKWVQQYDVCQRSKSMSMSSAGLLHPLSLPNQVWEDLTMDFTEGLPKLEGMNTILVVVDRLAKYAYFLPLKHPFTARTVAELFLREIICLQGVPSTIISSRDKVSLNHFWQELFRLQRSELRRSTTYHPQMDRQSEVVNRYLETYLRCCVPEKPRVWC